MYPNTATDGVVLQARSQNCEKRLLVSSFLSVCPSVRMGRLGCHWMNFHEIWSLKILFLNLSINFTFHRNLNKITGTVHEGRYKFMVTSGLILLRMRNVSDNICIVNRNTFCVQHLFPIKCAAYEIMWENMTQLDRSQMAI